MSSSAPAVSLPADGEYLCLAKGIAICRDRGGDSTATTLASDTDSTPTSGVTVYDPTLSVGAGTVYFRQSEHTATGSIETIKGVSIHGGPSTTIVTAPQNNGDEGVGLGSPQVSPDGRFLAYVITIGLMRVFQVLPSRPRQAHWHRSARTYSSSTSVAVLRSRSQSIRP